MHEVKDGKITMSTGVVFKVKDVPVMAFEAINRSMVKTRPSVPVVYMEDKARDEPNPNDKDYLARMDDWDRELSTKMIDAVVSLGVEVASLPEGFPEEKDDSWSKKMVKLGIDIPEDDQFLCWVKYCAAPTLKDMNSLVLVCSRSAGVTEEDVAEAAAIFRGSEERQTN